MPRKAPEARLNNRTARQALAPRKRPYYRLARAGAYPVHLGYYRAAGGRPGTWSARRYVGSERYETEALGSADDDPRAPADGTRILNFDQAQRAALIWADQRHAAERASAAAEDAPTIGKAVESYIAARKVRDSRAGMDAEQRLSHHVLAAPIAKVSLASVTDADFTKWRASIKRGGRAFKPSTAPLAAGTLARLLNDLRAALRAAAIKSRLPADVLATITEGCKRPEGAGRARAKQLLSDADTRRLVAAAEVEDADFGALVLVLAATGARFDQVARTTVADFQPDARRLMVPLSRKGRGTKAQTHVAVPLSDDVVTRLRGLFVNRAGHDPLLMRWHHRQIAAEGSAAGLGTWEKVERRPWKHAAELTRAWHRVLAAADLPSDLVPYALRHTSIVRGLRAGLPVRLVAATHDTSMAMIEKHYAAHIVDQTEELLRRALVPLAPASVSALREVG